MLQARQPAENRGSVLRVVVGHHLASGLVIRQHPWRGRQHADTNGLAIDFDHITKLNALPDVSWLTIDGNAPLQNQLLHLQPRPQSRLCKHLVQLGIVRLRQKYPLGHLGGRVCGFLIKCAAHDIRKRKGVGC